MLLADGDPALLEECKQDGEIDADGYEAGYPRTAPETPEEIRAVCSEALFELAASLIRDGASLTRIAVNVATNKKGSRAPAGIIRQYMTRNQFGARHVRTITRQFVEMIDADKPRRTKRETVADNVIRPAFTEAAS